MDPRFLLSFNSRLTSFFKRIAPFIPRISILDLLIPHIVFCRNLCLLFLTPPVPLFPNYDPACSLCVRLMLCSEHWPHLLHAAGSFLRS
jgi:hypothetical protein